MPGPFRPTHKLVFSGTQYSCTFIQTPDNLYHVSMVDPGIPIQDGSEFTIIPDEEQNVYTVVGDPVTRNRFNTSNPYYKEFDAIKRNGP